MNLRHLAGLALALGLLTGCNATTRELGGGRPGDVNLAVETAQLPPAGEMDEASLMPIKPATKNNVIVAQPAAAFSYMELASRIDRTFRTCWLGKNAEFAGYTYGGMIQEDVKFIIALNEQVNGQPMVLVKFTIVPASGQNGFAVSMESRAEGSPGEKIMRDGIRHLASGQKVC